MSYEFNPEYVPYFDGYIKHYKDKIVLTTQEKKEEFFLKSDYAFCIDDTPLVYFFDGEFNGYLNLETGFIQLDVLIDIRKMEFKLLKAYNIDEIVCVGSKPYSLFEQDTIIQELKDNGVTTIINLMQEYETKYNLVKIEIEIEKEFRVVNISMVDNSVPSIETLYEIIHIIDKSEKTYINCDLGLERTDVIVAYYLHKKYAYNDQSIIQKIEELKKDSILLNTEVVVTKEQKEFILKLV